MNYQFNGTDSEWFNFDDIVKSDINFNLINDGIVDCTESINKALSLTQGRCRVVLPPGVYSISERILIRYSNIVLEGSGIGVTKIICNGSSNYQAIDVRTSAANNYTGGNISNITIKNLTIDGGKNSRIGVGGGNGILFYCDTQHLLSGIIIDSVEIVNCPAAGILLSGLRDGANNSYKVQSVVIQNCTFTGNNRPGIEQTKVFDARIFNNLFYLNGLENLTIDVYTWSCIVSGNRFGAHLGGTGNIGVDSGDYCIINSNIIDNQNNTNAGISYRAGISLNSQLSGGQGCNSVVISDNIIQNCTDYGIIIRDDTGEYFGQSDGFIFLGEKAGGNVTINSNVFTNNGIDLRIEDGVAPTIVKGNDLQTIQLAEPDTSLIQLETGMIAYHINLSGDQSINVNGNDTNWKTVQLNQIIKCRLCSLSNYSLVLPVSGLYQFNFKVRYEGNIPVSNNTQFLSAGLKTVVPGDSQAGLFYISNIDKNQISLDYTNEINGSISQFLSAGEVQLVVRIVTSQSQSINLKLYDTFLSGYLIS